MLVYVVIMNHNVVIIVVNVVVNIVVGVLVVHVCVIVSDLKIQNTIVFV